MEYKSKTPYIGRAKQGVFQTADNEIITEALQVDSFSATDEP